MQHEQIVADMVDEVLLRQARRARAARTGEHFEEALLAILQTEAGHQLRTLREGPHPVWRAKDWQEDVTRAREAERIEYKRGRA